MEFGVQSGFQAVVKRGVNVWRGLIEHKAARRRQSFREKRTHAPAERVNSSEFAQWSKYS
jgi:hypothetical protein